MNQWIIGEKASTKITSILMNWKATILRQETFAIGNVMQCRKDYTKLQYVPLRKSKAERKIYLVYRGYNMLIKMYMDNRQIDS